MWYLVMPMIQGERLSSRIAQSPISTPKAFVIAHRLAEGLAACHKMGVVHRDIKPENIMITEDDMPIFIDFGINYQEGVHTYERPLDN